MTGISLRSIWGLYCVFSIFSCFKKTIIELIFLSFISLDLPDFHNVLCINLSRLYFSIACGFFFFFLSRRKIIFCDYNHLLCPCVSFSRGMLMRLGSCYVKLCNLTGQFCLPFAAGVDLL